MFKKKGDENLFFFQCLSAIRCALALERLGRSDMKKKRKHLTGWSPASGNRIINYTRMFWGDGICGSSSRKDFALGDNSQGGGPLMKVNGGLITHSLAVTGTGTQLKEQSPVRQEHRTCKGAEMRLNSTFPSSGCWEQWQASLWDQSPEIIQSYSRQNLVN